MYYISAVTILIDNHFIKVLTNYLNKGHILSDMKNWVGQRYPKCNAHLNVTHTKKYVGFYT